MKNRNQPFLAIKEYLEVQGKLNRLIDEYGCKLVASYLNSIPLRMYRKDGRNIGAYIESKICEEYQISRIELYELCQRHDLTEIRQLSCVLIDKYLGMNRTDISRMFSKTRHFAKRLIVEFHTKLQDNHPIDKKLLERYARLDALINKYVDFQPKK